MYKTVRKGDASLQYTILPQTDQFPHGGFPATSGKARPRVVKYIMGSLMILIILSCVATPFLMNQYDRNLFTSTMLAIGRVGYGMPMKNATIGQTKGTEERKGRSKLTTTTVTSLESPRRKDLPTEMNVVSRRPFRVDDQDSTMVFTRDTTSTSPRESSETVTNEQVAISSTPASTLPTSVRKLSPTTSTVTTKSSTVLPKLSKVLRVTLKLKENETIPKMYMQAGIASYKQGNITTSVLAHRLSLEGLIIKTPEGTIKPWPQKWLFSDAPTEFQWKNQMPVTIYIVLATLAALASLSIVLMFYVQRKASKRHRPSVEEPEVGGQDEDKSTLLGADNQETEEKE